MKHIILNKKLRSEIRMSERPKLDNNLDSNTFKEYYYLKKELIDFCRKNDLQITDGKLELTKRIVNFLDIDKKLIKLTILKIKWLIFNTIIEKNFV